MPLSWKSDYYLVVKTGEGRALSQNCLEVLPFQPSAICTTEEKGLVPGLLGGLKLPWLNMFPCSVRMLREKVFYFKSFFFRFTFCVGFTLLHHEFGRELSSVSLHRCHCKFVKRQSGDQIYPLNNARFRFHQTYRIKLPRILSYFQLIQISFKIQEDRIRLFG